MPDRLFFVRRDLLSLSNRELWGDHSRGQRSPRPDHRQVRQLCSDWIKAARPTRIEKHVYLGSIRSWEHESARRKDTVHFKVPEAVEMPKNCRPRPSRG